MATPEQLKAAFDRIKGICATLKTAKGWSGIGTLAKCAPIIVSEIEKVGTDIDIKNEDRKTLALDILCYLVPDSWLPDAWVRILAGWAIEKALSIYRSSHA